MKTIRVILALVAAAGLAACADTNLVSRNASPNAPLLNAAPEAVQTPSYNVTALNVVVPETLKVSEANSFYPGADIVWRGDPFGNRHQQIKAMFEAGMGKGIARLNGGTDVIVDIVVQRFHSVTERTRYTVGGVHSIRFAMTIRDAATGAVLEPTRVIEADLNAFGGLAAVRAEAIGQTQKVRITEHLEKVILHELTKPRDFLQV